MDRLGYVVAVGRSLFPLFALQAALEATMIPALRRRMKSLRLAACVVPALSLVYYYPAVFRTVVSGRFWLLPLTIHVSLAWIILYLVAAGLLFFQEYHATTMPVFKRNTRYVLLSFASISTLYLLYASKDPAQIYNMFISEYIRLGISSYISGALPALGWIILGLCTVFFVVLGSYNLVRYTQLTYDDTRQDMILKRKFDAAGTGVSVFVHGVKNQLLSSRVLHKKLSRALAGDPPDMAQVRACAVQLNELNEGMLRRMDELYRTVKNNSIALTAVPVEGLVEAAVERFHGKYPGQPVRLDVGTDRLVLADLSHLSEAVCNLLCNGYEAAVQAGREEPQVVLRVRAERMWTVLEVEDNGPGIPPERQGKIFEPFVTSKNTNYNWGMGLYYVRKIVRSHLGRLRLESRDGEGARFQIMLPLYDPVRRSDHTMAKTIRVMVAEDFPLLREDFCDVVSAQSDMEVVGSAASGEEIASLADTVPCDVILMDIEMETIDAGIRAAEVITARHPEVKILFLTAHETDDMITSAMGTGAVDYVVKGCEEERLLEHIRRASEGRAELDPKIQNTVMQEYARLRRSERSLIFFINNVAHLTPAEHELVKLLLQDKKVAEIARLRCVEVVTIKTQIKGLLGKFGCSRTKEIVKMIRQMNLEHLFQ
ncbi:MAG: response regulator [Flavonifractor plautii]